MAKSKTGSSTTPKRYEKRREAFIHAAAAVFAEKGFHGASTQDIADRLGINQAALYYYFRSKEAALEAVCFYGISRAVERIRQVVGVHRPLQETLPRIFFSQISGWQIHCDHLTVYQKERHLLTGERRERIREEGRNYQRIILGLLQKAQRKGEISPEVDVELATRGLMSLGGSVVGLYRRGEAHDIEHIAKQFSRLFYAGIRPSADGAGRRRRRVGGASAASTPDGTKVQAEAVQEQPSRVQYNMVGRPDSYRRRNSRRPRASDLVRPSNE